MKRIALSGKANQLFATVDDSDYEVLLQYKWYLRSGYAYRMEQYYQDGKRRGHGIAMHRSLLDAKSHQLVDHINYDRLDNQRSNLRIATKSQNSQNRVLPITNTSGYKGVTWSKSKNKWQVALKHNQKYVFVGRFDNILDAAKAYNIKAKELFGEYAVVN